MTSLDLLSNCLRAAGLLATIIFQTIRGVCSIQPLRRFALTTRWFVGCPPRIQPWEPTAGREPTSDRGTQNGDRPSELRTAAKLCPANATGIGSAAARVPWQGSAQCLL